MIIQLIHKFAKLCNCKESLLKDVVTLSQFMKNIEKESKKQGLFYKDSNTFKGEAFECFVEFLNKKLPLYIYDYAPLSRSDTDTGVDGIGTGLNGKPATVQIKYRENTQALLTANEDHLSNFTSSSVFKYNVDPKDTKNMIIFTTAKDLHYFTKDEMLFGKVVCIGFDEISQLVDNNIVFWRDFKESLLAVTNTNVSITFKINKLYEHQKEALHAINKNSRGIIHLPTGTGKTTIIARSIIDRILKNPTIEPIVVASPRIILTHQILNDIRGELLKHKINCKYISVNSGRAEDNNDYRNLEDLLNFDHHLLENTTCIDDIKNAYINSKSTNVPLIILAVYNSVERIVQAGIPVDSIYCDEAHYLLNEQFNYITNESIFNGANKYYFTATLRETKSSDSVGMNNKNKYGEIIYAKSPAEMIKAGIIVRPRVHIVSSVKSFIISSTNPKQKDAIDPHAIITAFEEHKTLCKTGAKLLVICKGTEHLEGICNSKYFINYCNSHPSLSVYSVTSQFGAKVTRDLNGDGKLDKDEINKSIKRTEMLKQIKELKDSDDAIIFHIDILTEGIDVPGITGIIPLAPLGRAKMLQNLGRASRLHKTDREKLAKKKLSTDFSKLNKYGESIEALKYVKPYCYIILPNYTEENIEQKENWKELILNLRTYGFNPTEDVVLVANRGTKKPQPLSTLNSANTNVKGISTKVIKLVNEIEKEEETNKFYTSIANCKTLEELSDLYGIQKDTNMSYKESFLNFNKDWYSNNRIYLAKYLPEDQIITPHAIIEKMFSKINIDWTNPNLKICDPCCGSGSFLIYCLIKLIEAGHSKKHIIENMLYGTDISLECINFIKVFWKFDQYNHNLRTSSILSTDWSFKNMQFDLIIMNPPYKRDLHLNILKTALKYISSEGKIVNLSPDAWLINPYREFDNSNTKNMALKEIATHIEDFEHISVEKTNELFNTNSWFGVGIFTLTKAKTAFNSSQFLTYNKLVYKILSKIHNLPSLRANFISIKKATNPNTFVCVRRNNHKYLFWCERDNLGIDATEGIQFNSVTEANNFIDSIQNTWLYKYLNKTDWNNSENSASVPFMQDYTKTWDNKRFCNYFNITGYVSDTTAVAGSEWEEILNTLK